MASSSAPPTGTLSAPTAKRSTNLTLAQLVSHDDVLTDALVDHVYYWTTIRKNRPRYIAARSLKEEEVADQIRRHIIHNKDVKTAMKNLESLPGLAKYMSRLKSDADSDHFRRHLERYAQIYLPDCPFEVTTTNRYTIFSHEASVTARKSLKVSEKIKYLTGHQVIMTNAEEAHLELTQRNFSIVFSSRKKTQSLFLGPARFANHDCDANARLTPVGSFGMEVVAIKPIQVDEEITVSYGDDYFGERNRDCLCLTCEKHNRNGWNKLGLSYPHNSVMFANPAAPALSIEVTDLGYSLRSIRSAKRKLLFDSPLASRDGTPDPKRQRTPISRTATMMADTIEPATPNSARLVERPYPQTAASNSLALSPTLQISTSVLPHARPTSRHFNRISLSPEPLGASPKPLLSAHLRAFSRHGPSASLVAESTQSARSPSRAEDALSLAILGATSPHAASITDKPAPDESDQSLSRSTPPTSIDGDRIEPSGVIEKSVVAEASPTAETLPLPLTPAPDTNIPLPAVTVAQDTSPLPDTENLRYPGDYLQNKGLLAEPNSDWVTCQTCERRWIQANAYERRVSCPRCERHSKLYGYGWPKTEREGSWDREERIVDHREVDRVVGQRKKWDSDSLNESGLSPSRARSAQSSRQTQSQVAPQIAKYSGIWKGWKPQVAIEKEKSSQSKARRRA